MEWFFQILAILVAILLLLHAPVIATFMGFTFSKKEGYLILVLFLVFPVASLFAAFHLAPGLLTFEVLALGWSGVTILGHLYMRIRSPRGGRRTYFPERDSDGGTSDRLPPN